MMGDEDDADDSGVVVNAVDDPVGAASRAVSVVQWSAEPAPDPVWVLEQRAFQERQCRGSDGLWQLLGKLAGRERQQSVKCKRAGSASVLSHADRSLA